MGNRKIVLLFFISTFPLYAQLNVWDIETHNRRPYSQVSLIKFQNDSLYVTAYGNSYSLCTDSIKTLSQNKGTMGGVGLFFGMIGGAVIGGLIGKNSADEDEGFLTDLYDPVKIAGSALIGTFLGGLIGYAIGHKKLAGIHYDFTDLSHQEKTKILTRLTNPEKRKSRW